jgi:hypothetical protein
MTDSTPTHSTANVAITLSAMQGDLNTGLRPKERLMPPLPTFSNAVGLLTSKSGRAGGDPTGTAARITLAGLVAVLTTNTPGLGAGLQAIVEMVSGRNVPPTANVIPATMGIWRVVEAAVVKWAISLWNGRGLRILSKQTRSRSHTYWVSQYDERLPPRLLSTTQYDCYHTVYT